MTNAAVAPLGGCFVRVENVSKAFRSGSRTESRVVVDNVSLSVEAGSVVALVGRSGVGKSTLLRLIGGLLPPDDGVVWVDQQTADEARQAKAIGFMPQAPALLAWRTVTDNVQVVQRVNRQFSHHQPHVADVLAAVGLSAYPDAFPAQLSGGMQHRVALARALAVGGPMLLLDEPFSSLDEMTRSALYDLLIDTWKQHRRTIVVVTHNLDEAVLLADRIVVMAGVPGRIVDIVDVVGDRPRREALDGGAYASVLARVRAQLEEVPA